MRRVFTWGLPLYAAVMTGIFVGKGIPDNSLRAEEDAARATVIKAVPPASTNVPPAPATGSNYPIPAPVAQPKHLFHFVIRYEGDGMPDPTMLATAVAAAGDIPISMPKKSDKPNVVKVKAPDLFQFIIRYEGDGIVDDNVAKVLKDYFTAALSEKASPPVRELRSAGNSPQYGAMPQPSPESPTTSSAAASPGTPNPPATLVPPRTQVAPATGTAAVRRAPAPAPRNTAPAKRAPAPKPLPVDDE
ncbi:MAG TPA: hypothetical protein VN641_05560 [Urbifossiella sp.]|nr:hypothetical protein [Urbifossiella sp.]